MFIHQRTMTLWRTGTIMAGVYPLSINMQWGRPTLCRDYIVGNITGSNIPTLDLNTSTLTYSGETSTSSGWKYKTSITYVTGLLPNSSIGINHNETVAISGVTNAVDGLVAVLTVSITAQGTDNSSSSQSDSGSSRLVHPRSMLLWPF